MTLTNEKGFTLIEIMITMIIIGVLSAVAIPTYQESIKNSRRTDAQSTLLNFASAMERHFTLTGSYEGRDADNDGIPDPAFFASESPIEGSTKFYDLRFVFTATTYTLYALPKNAQAGDGPFLITHTGRQGWARVKANNVADAQYTEPW